MELLNLTPKKPTKRLVLTEADVRRAAVAYFEKMTGTTCPGSGAGASIKLVYHHGGQANNEYPMMGGDTLELEW